jgi:hypothetical protein
MYDPKSWAWRRRQLDAAVAKITEFEDECRREAARLSALARRWGAIHVTLGLPAAVLATVAGVSALADLYGPRVSGWIALVAGALSGASAFFGGGLARQQRAQAASSAHEALANEAEQFVAVRALDPRDKLDAPEVYQDLMRRRAAVRDGKELARPIGIGMHSFSQDEDLSWVIDDPPTSSPS